MKKLFNKIRNKVEHIFDVIGVNIYAFIHNRQYRVGVYISIFLLAVILCSGLEVQ